MLLGVNSYINMKEVTINKYLGCLLSATVRQSITATVDNRINHAKRAIYEIRTIVEDSRADSLGAVQLGLELWRGSVLTSLLSGSEVWMDVSPKTMKKLEDTNSLFLANLFGVSKRGCPTVSLYSESSTLFISNHILLTKLLFLHHIATLPRTALANEIYQTMKANNYPGIVKNCQKYLTEWNMTDVETYTKMA